MNSINSRGKKQQHIIVWHHDRLKIEFHSFANIPARRDFQIHVKWNMDWKLRVLKNCIGIRHISISL